MSTGSAAPARAFSLQGPDLAFAVTFALGLAAWLVSFVFGAVAAWRALLASFLFFTPLAGGMAVWPAVVQASKGRWAGDSERLALLGLSFAPASLAILVVLWLAADSFAPWPGRTFVQGWWLDADFLFARDVLALALFWGSAWLYLDRRRRRGGAVAGPACIITYACVFSLLGFDLVMALTPDWYSSLFGGYFFVSGLYAGVAAWALLVARAPDPDPDRLHDLGKLTVALSLLTTYCLYSQLLPIWYENLPYETGFVARRMHVQPFSGVGAALCAVVYLGPLLLLLTARVKRRPDLLGGVCGLILLGLWLERWWLVVPSLPGGPVFGLADVGAGLALLGLFGFGVLRLDRLLPDLPVPRGEQP
uniref:Polysulfide reductase n=1 Tax=Desulfovibrio sp. U5L TaxID=596152 RepID=I2Q390_9BACT